jgi:[acyl-carrier-protein] S-malonyltransferase
MLKTAFIFPGQGSQYVGMGKDLFLNSPEAKAVFDHADAILGFPLSKVCFEGPVDDLRQTRNTQPAIFVHSIAVSRILGHVVPDLVAGHSLGEYSALVAAGAISFEDGLRIVRMRGELMQKAGENQKGTMAAIVGLDPEVVDHVCATASDTGIVQSANFNSPGQIVISGSIDGVRKAMELARTRGAKMAKELVVSGAFHSPLMQSAMDGLRTALERTRIVDAKIPVYTNVTAEPVTAASQIRDLLIRQITSPVRWEQTVRNMVRDGAGVFLEIGPGKVLQGLMKRIEPSVQIAGYDTFVEIRPGVPAS